MSDSVSTSPQILIVMGSASDHETMKSARDMLQQFGVQSEYVVASAHRAPQRVSELARGAKEKGIKVIIAGAGGAAHLPGVIASQTTVPVIGVPIPTQVLGGLDSLLSIVQMPGGIPVATVAIGSGGAKNAALLAVQILALNDTELSHKLERFREDQTVSSLKASLS